MIGVRAIPRPGRPERLGRDVAAGALLLAGAALFGVAANDLHLLLVCLAGLGVLGLALLTLLRPETAVVSLPFLLFTRMTETYGGSLGAVVTPFQGMIALYAIAVLAPRLVRRRGLVVDRGLAWMLAFGAATALSAWEAPSRADTADALLSYLREVAILFVLVNLVTSGRSLRLVIWALTLAGAFLAVTSILYATTGYDVGGLAQAQTGLLAGSVYGSRLVGPVKDSNEFARVLVTVVPLALYRFWDERQPLLRLAALGVLALIIPVIVLTYSRDGLLALVGVLALTVAMRRVKPSRLLALGLVLGLAVAVAPQSYWDRINATVQFFLGQETDLAQSDTSLQERSLLWQVGARMFLDHPLTGIGAGNYDLVYLRYAWQVSPALTTRPLAAHSTPVQIAAETGLLGLATFVAIPLVVVAGLRDAKRRFTQAGLTREKLLAESIELSIYGYLFASLFLSYSTPRYFWLPIGLAMVVRQVAIRLEAAAPAGAAPAA